MGGISTLLALGKAGKKIGALPDATNAAEDMARKILELRAAGKADEVTEAMMSAADNPYMYANTPLDMSQEARMARADEMGFDVDNVSYHGTKVASLDKFDPVFMKQGLGGKVLYSTDTPLIASDYAGGDLPYNEFIESGSEYCHYFCAAKEKPCLLLTWQKVKINILKM